MLEMTDKQDVSVSDSSASSELPSHGANMSKMIDLAARKEALEIMKWNYGMGSKALMGLEEAREQLAQETREFLFTSILSNMTNENTSADN